MMSSLIDSPGFAVMAGVSKAVWAIANCVAPASTASTILRVLKSRNPKKCMLMSVGADTNE